MLRFDARLDEPEIVTALLEAGADPARRTASGSTAQDLAKQLGAQDALEALEIWKQQRKLNVC